MKNKNKTVPAPSNLNLLRQICNFIPDFLVPKLARETGVEQKVRTFSAWSHVVSLLYAQLTHSIGLNDVCDALGLHSGPLSSLRGATAPSRNNLSNSNNPMELPDGREQAVSVMLLNKLLMGDLLLVRIMEMFI